MKAIKVNEALEFNRDAAPMDKLGVGIPDVREITAAQKEINDIIDNGYSRDEMAFGPISDHIDKLRKSIDLTVMNHIRKKYGWDLQKMTENSARSLATRAFSVTINDIWIVFTKSSTSRSFGMEIYAPGEERFDMQSSTSLRTLDRKIDEVIKKYKLK